jgi:(S)-ureidoglycine aminohydrolase
MTDIVTSFLPFWDKTRLWVLARPMSGFAETFSHYIMEVAKGGGSSRPDDSPQAEHVLFVVEGSVSLEFNDKTEILNIGGYAYLPAGLSWKLHHHGTGNATFHWIRKSYQDVDGIDRPEPFITSDQAVKPISMPDTNDMWLTSRFVDPEDLRHDMHVNIVTFQPGGVIPFAETHVMEHGLYVLQGKGDYYLNGDWKKVEAGDYMWLRAFCPQACHAEGSEPFRYLLYKDVNRHMPFITKG